MEKPLEGPLIGAGGDVIFAGDAAAAASAAAALDYLQTVAVALEVLERMVHNQGDWECAKMADVVEIGRAAMTSLVGLVARSDTITAAVVPRRREDRKEDESIDRGRRHAVRRRVVDRARDVRPQG